MTSQVSNVNGYFNDDTVFNAINKTCVSLQEKDIKENNVHLRKVIDKLLERMKYEDIFFEKVYRNTAYGGSYYKKTRVGKPDEFDLNIIIKLPINYKQIKIESCYPGFVKIYSGLNLDGLEDNDKIHKTLRKLHDPDMCLNQEMLRHWMESVLSKTVKKLPGTDARRILQTDTRAYVIKITKTGPAFTLHIGVYSDKVISVDLVPVLELSHKLPNINHDLSYFQTTKWYAVPKPLDRFEFDGNKQLYWRTCFYQQEKQILSKNGKIKPVLRQMKKLRDTQNWKHMASYYIETLCLHVLQEGTNLEKMSYTSLFMMMLQKFHIALKIRCIPYYWDTNFNLLSKLRSEEIENIKGRLGNIISCINKNISTDSCIIARYVLTAEELSLLMTELSPESSEDEKFVKSEESVENGEPVESDMFSNVMNVLYAITSISWLVREIFLN